MMREEQYWSPQMRKWMRGLPSGRRRSPSFDPRSYSRPRNDPEIHKAPLFARIAEPKTVWKVRAQTPWSPQMERWLGQSKRHGMLISLTGVGSSIQPHSGPLGLTDDSDTILLTDETSGFTLIPG